MWIDPVLTISGAAPMLQGSIPRVWVQRRHAATRAARTKLPCPIGQELVLPKHLHDVGVGSFEELRQSSFPKNSFLAKTTGTHSSIFTNIRNLLPQLCFLRCGPFLNGARLAFLRDNQALHHFGGQNKKLCHKLISKTWAEADMETNVYMHQHAEEDNSTTAMDSHAEFPAFLRCWTPDDSV